MQTPPAMFGSGQFHSSNPWNLAVNNYKIIPDRSSHISKIDLFWTDFSRHERTLWENYSLVLASGIANISAAKADRTKQKEVKPAIVLLNIEQCNEDCETIVIFVFDHM